jgi:hypothetical protein
MKRFQVEQTSGCGASGYQIGISWFLSQAAIGGDFGIGRHSLSDIGSPLQH